MDKKNLIFLSGPLQGMTLELEEELYTCGRSSDNTIKINDPSVSAKHCKFALTGSGEYVVIDEESTNGVIVNNKKIKYTELHQDDVIYLGNIQILYTSEEKSVGVIENTYVNTLYVEENNQ